MKITFIGVGYVGLITSLSIANRNLNDNFFCIDINKNIIKKLQEKVIPFFEPDLQEQLLNAQNISFTTDQKLAYKNADICFICVGTPLNENSEWDLTHLKKSICEIIKYNSNVSIVIKSTVPIGTCEKIRNELISQNYLNIRIYNNPEFLSQGTAVYDANNPNRIIIGFDDVNNKYDLQIFNLYKNYRSPILTMSTKASEMSKIVANNYLASRLSFFNEISNICRQHNIKSLDVINSLKYDDRIGSKYITPGIGYGGSCLPKDSESLYNWSKQNGYLSKMVKATIDINNQQKIILAKILRKHTKRKNVAILGTSFKKDTDDTRDSSALFIIDFLLKYNYTISVYDPKAIPKTKQKYADQIQYFDNIEDCIKSKDAVLICCDWNEIKEYPLKNYVKFMNNPLMIDGYSLFIHEIIPDSLIYLPLNK